MLADQLQRAFPELGRIRDVRLRELVAAQWLLVSERNPAHGEIERIPLHPSLPIERHGGLAAHIRAQMSVVGALVPAYAREWRIELDLDHFLVCALIHDSAKVIEFVERDGRLVATPGYDHAYEGAKIAIEVGFPREVAHMVAVHTFLGPKRLPRTAAAQLFQFIDPICLPVFPEHGKGAVERHLEANGWAVAGAPEDLP